MTSHPLPRIVCGRRGGFALAGALLAMVVVGALITGSFFAASQEHAIGLSAGSSDEALYVAEYSLNQALEEVSSLTLQQLTRDTLLHYSAAPGDTLKFAVVNGDTVGRATVWVHPSGPNYLFVARAVAIRGDTRRRGGTRLLGLIVHTRTLGFPTDRAMQIYGALVARGSSIISGRDTFPQGPGQSQWATCGSTGTHAAVVARDTTRVSRQGSAHFIGQPALAEDASMDSASFLHDVNYDNLVARATRTYAGGTHPHPAPSGTATTCEVAALDNWGEPGLPNAGPGLVAGCERYFPIIHVMGDLQLPTQGRGQGILLVDGNLQLSGGFEFWGIVVVRGNLTSSGAGGHLNGTVMTMNSSDLHYDDVAVGSPVVELSSCAVKRAAANIPGYNVGLPLQSHSFIDLTAVGAGF